ncbi:MAG: hypothetical protein HQL24_06340 [Candidatus Omnitrophica bacterium]|nr:hypothetical protein [Candidatus Omnitrophota bacterium]
MSQSSVKDRGFWPGSMFALWPPFCLGFKDCTNCSGLANVVIFIMFLSLIGKTRKRLIWCGLLFILSAGLINFFLTLGLFDFVLNRQNILRDARTINLILSVFFIVLGVLNFVDWTRYKKTKNPESFILKSPFFLGENVESSKKSGAGTISLSIGLGVLSIALGFLSALLASFLGSDYVLFLELVSHANTLFTSLCSIGTYCLMLALPVIGVWLMMIWAFSSSKVRLCFRESISLIKIICSAMLLAVGVGLGYAFLR